MLPGNGHLPAVVICIGFETGGVNSWLLIFSFSFLIWLVAVAVASDGVWLSPVVQLAECVARQKDAATINKKTAAIFSLDVTWPRNSCHRHDCHYFNTTIIIATTIYC